MRPVTGWLKYWLLSWLLCRPNYCIFTFFYFITVYDIGLEFTAALNPRDCQVRGGTSRSPITNQKEMRVGDVNDSGRETGGQEKKESRGSERRGEKR